MASTRKQILKNLERMKKGKKIAAGMRNATVSAVLAINQVQMYLDAHKGSRTPMSYSDLDRLFGKINVGHLVEVLENAIQIGTQRRQKALEDSGQKDGESGRKLLVGGGSKSVNKGKVGK